MLNFIVTFRIIKNDWFAAPAADSQKKNRVEFRIGSIFVINFKFDTGSLSVRIHEANYIDFYIRLHQQRPSHTHTHTLTHRRILRDCLSNVLMKSTTTTTNPTLISIELEISGILVWVWQRFYWEKFYLAITIHRLNWNSSRKLRLFIAK